MHDLVPITPLGKLAPIVETHGPVTITEVTNFALASVAARLGRENQAREVLVQFMDADVPATERLSGTSVRAFWIGAEQWMVEAPILEHEDLAHKLAVAMDGAASVTEQSDAWCRFDLTGNGLADVFALLCAANTKEYVGGEAVRTVIDHLGCFILCCTPQHFTVLGPRSSAGSLHHALVTAIRSAH